MCCVSEICLAVQFLVLEMKLLIFSDLLLLESLFDVLSFASDDFEAKGAVWNIIARLLAHIKEEEMSLSSLDQFVLTLVSKSDTIEDDLLDHQSEKSRQQDDSLAPGSTNPDPRATAVSSSAVFSF